MIYHSYSIALPASEVEPIVLSVEKTQQEAFRAAVRKLSPLIPGKPELYNWNLEYCTASAIEAERLRETMDKETRV